MFELRYGVAFSETNFSTILPSTKEQNNIIVEFFRNFPFFLGYVRHNSIEISSHMHSDKIEISISLSNSEKAKFSLQHFETERDYFRVSTCF